MFWLYKHCMNHWSWLTMNVRSEDEEKFWRLCTYRSENSETYCYYRLYNNVMGGVNHQGQVLSYIPVMRSTLKVIKMFFILYVWHGSVWFLVVWKTKWKIGVIYWVLNEFCRSNIRKYNYIILSYYLSQAFNCSCIFSSLCPHTIRSSAFNFCSQS